jgi:ribosomal protein S18 acetylase RimI-like enzyme
MTEYCIVPHDRWREAYQWHLGFADQNRYILRRQWEEYERFAQAQQVWCALGDHGDFLGLAYSAYDAWSWELGGLMVAPTNRRDSLGSNLARLVLGNLLFLEDPLSCDQTVLLHVRVENTDVIPLVERVLGFRKVREIEHEWYATPEHPGEIAKGYEFQLLDPEALELLARWCEEEEEKGTRISFPESWQSLKLWAEAFRDMAREMARKR